MTDRKTFTEGGCTFCGKAVCSCKFKEREKPMATPADVKPLVAQYLLEQGLTKADFEQCVGKILSGIDIPTKEYIKQVFETCQRNEADLVGIILGQLGEYDFPQLQNLTDQIKTGSALCFSNLIEPYCTKTQIEELVDDKFQGHEFPELQGIENLVKGLSAACFAELIKDYCTKEQIEALIAAGFPSETTIRSWAEQEAATVVNAFPFAAMISDALAASGFQSIAQIESIAKNQIIACTPDLNIPTQTLVEAWSKALFVTCINDVLNGLYLPTEEEFEVKVKAILFPCVKEIIEQVTANQPTIDPTEPDGNTRVSGLGMTCNDGVFSLQVLQSDNTVLQQDINLSKFLGETPNTVTSFSGFCDSSNNLQLSLGQSNGPTFPVTIPMAKLVPEEKPATRICFDYGGQTYTEDATGKITIQDHLKCERWDGGFEHVAFDPNVNCRVIGYKGPTQADIEQIAADIYDDLGGNDDTSTGGVTLTEVEQYVASIANTLCVTGFSATLNSDTGVVSFTITDQCGTKQDFITLPMDPTGNNGITSEQSKVIAENCINQTVNGIIQQYITDNLTILDEGDVNVLIEQYINDNLTIPDDNSITTLIQQYWTANAAQFCNTSVGVNFEESTRELTFTVTDNCGPKSGSVTLPEFGTGTSGITLAQAKTQAQTCIDDPANNARFCNANVTTALNGTLLQTAVADNCGTLSDVTDLSPLLTSYCLNGLQLGLTGSTLTATITQDNCPIQTASLNLPFDSTGNSVECCNTNFSATSFNADTCVITGTLNQSAGDPVQITIPLSEYFSATTETHTDGCSQYQSFKLGNKEIMKVPVWEPKTDCKCITIPADFSGLVSVGIIETGTTQTIDWGDDSGISTGPSGTNLSHTYAASTEPRVLTICNDNPCDGNVYQIDESGLPAGYTCNCCDC